MLPAKKTAHRAYCAWLASPPGNAATCLCLFAQRGASPFAHHGGRGARHLPGCQPLPRGCHDPVRAAGTPPGAAHGWARVRRLWRGRRGVDAGGRTGTPFGLGRQGMPAARRGRMQRTCRLTLGRLSMAPCWCPARSYLAPGIPGCRGAPHPLQATAGLSPRCKRSQRWRLSGAAATLPASPHFVPSQGRLLLPSEPSTSPHHTAPTHPPHAPRSRA